jgi:phosphopantetheine adenylyltransferase
MQQLIDYPSSYATYVNAQQNPASQQQITPFTNTIIQPIASTSANAEQKLMLQQVMTSNPQNPKLSAPARIIGTNQNYVEGGYQQIIVSPPTSQQATNVNQQYLNGGYQHMNIPPQVSQAENQATWQQTSQTLFASNRYPNRKKQMHKTTKIRSHESKRSPQN